MDGSCYQFLLEQIEMMRKNTQTVTDIYYAIKEQGIRVPETPPQSYCFRIALDNANMSLSISVPPDMRYGYVETALILNNHIHYDDSLGYDDIKRFDSIDELVAEIQTLIG